MLRVFIKQSAINKQNGKQVSPGGKESHEDNTTPNYRRQLGRLHQLDANGSAGAHGFYCPNSLSLAQAYYEPWWQPYGLYATIADAETMIGFAMFGRWPLTDIPAHHDGANPGADFILRFMIDGRYQGRGYGRAGMQALLVQIKAQPDVQAIEISYDIANPVMAHLCTQAGFQPTGRIDNGEREARLA